MSEQPQEIPVEVVPPGAGIPPRMTDGTNPAGSGVGKGAGPQPGKGGSEGPLTPFHPAAAGLMLLVDNLWMMPEFLVTPAVLTVPACFFSVLIPTWIIQRRMHGNSVGMAFMKALFLATVAAVPTSVTGTPVGLALLAWFGIRRFRQ
jgi:hypothetical protein